MYFINGFRFHTKVWSQGKKTINSGVWVKGSTNDEDENDYYGILKDVIELAYPGQPEHKVFLFECEWFDPKPDRGTKINKDYKIVEVRHTRRYDRFDPFIIASSARQVSYVPYPGKMKDKRDWWVAMPSKARNRVEIEGTLEVAFQDDNTSPVNPIDDMELVENLHDDTNEEVGISGEHQHDEDVDEIASNDDDESTSNDEEYETSSDDNH